MACAPGKVHKVNTMKLLKMASSPSQLLKRQLLQNSNFVSEDDEVYYQGKGKFQKVLFTREEKWKAFEEAHIVSKDRHHGIRATGVNITKSYYWPGITLDARRWVKGCEKCQKDRLAELEAQNSKVKAKKFKREETSAPEADQLSVTTKTELPLEPKEKWLLEPCEKQPLASQGPKKAPLSPKMELLPEASAIPREEAPVTQIRGLFHLIGLKLVGPMEQTPRGARFIFMAVDYFTQWVEAAPMKTCSPEETAEQLLKLIHRYGFPERIISTQNSEFIQQLNQILRTETEIQCDIVIEYHPQPQGFLQETNSFVKRLLSLVMRGGTDNWDLQLPEILFLQKQQDHRVRTRRAYKRPLVSPPHTDKETSPERVKDDSEEEALSSKNESSEEESLSSKNESEEGWDSAESWQRALFPTDALELSPDKETELVTVAILSVEDVCQYCNQLADSGNGDVFMMLQCGECQAWAHELCIKQWHGDEAWKTTFQCRACFLGHQLQTADGIGEVAPTRR